MANKTYAVIDATVNHTEARFRGLGAKYVLWEMERHGCSIVEPRVADIVLVSVISPHEYLCVPRSLKRVGIEPFAAKRQGQIIVLGGQGALSPKIFDPYIDVACVGEGKNFLAELVKDFDLARRLPNAWVPGETRSVVPDEDFPWDAPPIKAEDGIVRIYVSRGCEKKCLFCHTGWSVGFQENPHSQTLVKQHNALLAAGYRVNVVTNDAPALTFFSELKVEHFSASYSQTQEMLRQKSLSKEMECLKSIRFGVESPSTRLRRIIGKPIETQALFELSIRLLNLGVGVRWFMIAGLPGETESDYDELRTVVRDARHAIKKGALQLSFTAFCPDASAPMCLAPLADEYWDRFLSFWEWFFEGDGFTRKIQLFRCAAPKGRLQHAMASMGCSESQLREGFLQTEPPNWRVKYKYQHMARRAYDVYASRVGLPKSR